ncbi:DNA repair protein RecO [Candidatus Saccharibacteria bacterium]|nr:DNA repair protein RecO [Candidatus Saccharibacteria bacterium]
MQDAREYKGLAIVLSRTNYGEADRIIHFLTPEGVMSVIARGVRREKSKLRGGCEPFALNEVSVRSGKGLGSLRSARAHHLYERIIYNFEAMEVAADVIKLLQKVTRDHDDPQFFEILRQVLTELERTDNHQAVMLWAYLQVVGAVGTQLNLTHDSGGEALSAAEQYIYNTDEHAFVRQSGSQSYTARHIKLIRLAVAVDLATFLKVDEAADLLPLCLNYARIQLQQ